MQQLKPDKNNLKRVYIFRLDEQAYQFFGIFSSLPFFGGAPVCQYFMIY